MMVLVARVQSKYGQKESQAGVSYVVEEVCLYDLTGMRPRKISILIAAGASD